MRKNVNYSVIPSVAAKGIPSLNKEIPDAPSELGMTRHSDGFTLVEVLIAMTILAFIAVSTGTLIYNTTRAQGTIENEINSIHGISIAFKIISHDLRHALHEEDPPPRTNLSLDADERKNNSLFVGASDKVTFTSRSHHRLVKNSKEADTSVINYFLKESRDENRSFTLMKREKTIIDDSPNDGGNTLVLLENVKSVKWKFYSAKGDKWDDMWDTASSTLDTKGVFPEAVELTATVFDSENKEVTLTTKVKIEHANNKIKPDAPFPQG